MGYIRFMTLLLAATITSAQHVSSRGLREYCERENFNASCGQNEVILMRTAVYGRMRIGRCVTVDFSSNLGCQVDVLAKVHSKCSGKRQCSIAVTEVRGNNNPCPEQLLAFLEADYSCIKVPSCPSGICESRGFLPTSSSEGYLASIVTSRNGCGSSQCPWVISAPQGQRLNLTFHNYIHPGQSKCVTVATILEKASQDTKEVLFCETDNIFSHVTPTSTDVEVRMRVPILQGNEQPAYRFLLEYHAIGCSDPLLPEGSFIQRLNESTSVIVCQDDDSLSWQLTCIDGSWVGSTGSCTFPKGDGGASEDQQTASPTGGLLVVIGVGVALGIILGFAMLSIAIVFMKRRQANQEYGRRDSLLDASDVIASRDKIASGKLYDAHSPLNNDKLLPTPDSVTYSTYHVSRSTPQRNPRQGMASGKPMAVPIPDTQYFSTYYPGQGDNTAGPAQQGHHKDHVYEYPTFGGPTSCSRQNSKTEKVRAITGP